METTYATILLNLPRQETNLAVCEAPDGTLLWTEIPAEFAEPGSALSLSELQQLDTLSPEELVRILEAVEAIPPEELDWLRTGMEGAADDV